MSAEASHMVLDHEEERAAKRVKTHGPDDPETRSSEMKGPGDTLPAVHGQDVKLGASDDSTWPEEQTHAAEAAGSNDNGSEVRPRGMAPIKKEYLINTASGTAAAPSTVIDDDEAEGRGPSELPNQRQGDGKPDRKAKKDKKKKGGQNTERNFGRFVDAISLCNSRAFYPEFSPRECRFGDRCRLCHDLRKYLSEGRREDVECFGGQCPVFEAHGRCSSGWKCRFVKSHMKEVEHPDGRKELVLLDKLKAQNGGSSETNGEAAAKEAEQGPAGGLEAEEQRPGVHNVVSMDKKILLSRKRVDFSRADQYIKWLDHEVKVNQEFHHQRKDQSTPAAERLEEHRAAFVDPPFKPSEKRRIYFGPETPTLAPLTTQGNLPFRRLCVELGCQVTYSEMAVGLPLLQGDKADWTIMKAHESELTPPRFTPGSNLVFDNAYDNARDIKFGAQISASAHWVATKAADVLGRFCPHLRLIDLNCGCPIDMVFKSGGGSALLENHAKLERMIRGMNAVSGEIPITAKIRMGVKTSRPTAAQVVNRLAFGSRETRDRLGAPGCAAVTLHGRSREQRYTRRADWGYIGECAALVRSYNAESDALADTASEPDPSTLANTRGGRMYFLGNGDCYSHEEYRAHIDEARVDSVMIGRGALVKPWLFEEIEKGQYLDKSASERLRYVERFVRYGLDAWGSDELGIGFTRRFLLEWLSFAHRYVPIGLLETLPPSLNDRPPQYRGRDELETLLASDNYKDWIKISEMFLGPVHPDFKFLPKHKSNAYEAEG